MADSQFLDVGCQLVLCLDSEQCLVFVCIDYFQRMSEAIRKTVFCFCNEMFHWFSGTWIFCSKKVDFVHRNVLQQKRIEPTRRLLKQKRIFAVSHSTIQGSFWFGLARPHKFSPFPGFRST